VPFISYQDVTDTNNFHLRFATLIDGAWFTTTVDANPGTGYHSSIAVDAEGAIHIIYHNMLKAFYALYDNAAWIVRELGGTAVTGRTGLVISGGFPKAVYLDGGQVNTISSKADTGSGGGDPTGGGGDPTGGGGGGGGCFIATASFGALSADSVQALTAVRDCSLNLSTNGGALVGLYYSVSPALATSISETDAIRALLRTVLTD
jgi:hypothetical protein